MAKLVKAGAGAAPKQEAPPLASGQADSVQPVSPEVVKEPDVALQNPEQGDSAVPEVVQPVSPEVFEVRVTNKGFGRLEPYSQVMMLKDQETTIRVKTKVELKQVIRNIRQLNELSGFAFLTIEGGD